MRIKTYNKRSKCKNLHKIQLKLSPLLQKVLITKQNKFPSEIYLNNPKFLEYKKFAEEIRSSYGI